MLAMIAPLRTIKRSYDTLLPMLVQNARSCGFLSISTSPSTLLACSWMTAEGAIFEPARSAQNRTALATSDKRSGKGVQASQLDSQVCSGGEDGENGKHNGVRSVLEGSTETSIRIWVHLH